MKGSTWDEVVWVSQLTPVSAACQRFIVTEVTFYKIHILTASPNGCLHQLKLEEHKNTFIGPIQNKLPHDGFLYVNAVSLFKTTLHW